MIRRFLLAGSVLAAVVGSTGCQRLEEARPFEFSTPGDMPLEPLPYRDAIPMEFGDLIGISSSANYPMWAQAWFMREDKSIAVVWINARNGAIVDRALIIPRR